MCLREKQSQRGEGGGVACKLYQFKLSVKTAIGKNTEYLPTTGAATRNEIMSKRARQKGK